MEEAMSRAIRTSPILDLSSAALSMSSLTGIPAGSTSSARAVPSANNLTTAGSHPGVVVQVALDCLESLTETYKWPNYAASITENACFLASELSHVNGSDTFCAFHLMLPRQLSYMTDRDINSAIHP